MFEVNLKSNNGILRFISIFSIIFIFFNLLPKQYIKNNKCATPQTMKYQSKNGDRDFTQNNPSDSTAMPISQNRKFSIFNLYFSIEGVMKSVQEDHHRVPIPRNITDPTRMTGY